MEKIEFFKVRIEKRGSLDKTSVVKHHECKSRSVALSRFNEFEKEQRIILAKKNCLIIHEYSHSSGDFLRKQIVYLEDPRKYAQSIDIVLEKSSLLLLEF